MDYQKRTEFKYYDVMISNQKFQVTAQSMSDALRKVSNIRLEDRDVVTVREA